MNYIFRILSLVWPRKLNRYDIKEIPSRDIALFVSVIETIVGSYMIKTMWMQGSGCALPKLVVLTFVASFVLSYGMALMLFLLNLIVIKRLTYRECLKAIMPARIVNPFYMIVDIVLMNYGLDIFCMITGIVMCMHQMSLIIFYLRKLYFCSRKDISVIVVIYLSIMLMLLMIASGGSVG